MMTKSTDELLDRVQARQTRDLAVMDVLLELVEGAKRRLRKGRDNGDVEVLRLSLSALALMGSKVAQTELDRGADVQVDSMLSQCHKLGFIVPAVVRSVDKAHAASFDAAPYLEGASALMKDDPGMLVSLMERNYVGPITSGMAADAAADNVDVAHLQSYVGANPHGWETRLDGTAFRLWMAAHQPALYEVIAQRIAFAEPASSSQLDLLQTPGRLLVPAHVATDDGLVKADFDAEDWFQNASDEDLFSLIDCEFGGDDIADDVARHFEGCNSGVSAVLAHSAHMADVQRNSRSDLSGFECHVDEAAAKLWIASNRPELYAKAFVPQAEVQR